MKRWLLLGSGLISILAVSAQRSKEENRQVLINLQEYIRYLADDKLEGRRTGTAGEKLAIDYIQGKFRDIGLIPKGSKGYLQAFEVNEGKQIDPSTSMQINNIRLETGKDFFPMAFSPDASFEAMPVISIQETDMPWFVDLNEILVQNAANPHFDLPNYISTHTTKAYDKGASAIFIYNTGQLEDKLVFDAKDKSNKTPIPVIYLSKAVAEKYLKDPSSPLNLIVRIKVTAKTRTGNNVIGYIDNGATNTVILGAHFDHLGYGEDGNSLARSGGTKEIHNGADDNASGTAALIELARLLRTTKSINNNYLFIAFSGEELGLYGSKYFTQSPTIDLKNVNYMINMDMVGRLNDSTRGLTIGGYGTSPQWATVISEKKKKKDYFNIKIDSSGSGPSDHTSFYRMDIPVLFYFTGTHLDYHKPSDDFDKINYDGERQIVFHIRNLIESLDHSPKLAFLKTKEPQVSTTSFKVTLGIMPDYTYSGAGVRADGVTEGRPAFKAGLKTGDVITALGDHKVNSMETYMQALNKFKKGDKTMVKFKRGEKELEAPIEF